MCPEQAPSFSRPHENAVYYLGSTCKSIKECKSRFHTIAMSISHVVYVRCFHTRYQWPDSRPAVPARGPGPGVPPPVGEFGKRSRRSTQPGCRGTAQEHLRKPTERRPGLPDDAPQARRTPAEQKPAADSSRLAGGEAGGEAGGTLTAPQAGAPRRRGAAPGSGDAGGGAAAAWRAAGQAKS